jgi:hypothetical protein
MRVEESTVKKVVISEIVGLDPITVFLEDIGARKHKVEGAPDHTSRQGKITIECWGESWSAYWGGMGDRTVAQFVDSCNVDYLAGCLRRGTDLDTTMFSGDALEATAKRCILDCRRGRTSKWECSSLDRDDARALYDEAEALSSCETAESLWHNHDAGRVLSALFGDEWHHTVSDKAFIENPKYAYLCRIISAIKQAFEIPAETKAA